MSSLIAIGAFGSVSMCPVQQQGADKKDTTNVPVVVNKAVSMYEDAKDQPDDVEEYFEQHTMREIAFLTQFAHPHIAALRGVEEDKNDHTKAHLKIEYGGITLAQWCEQRQRSAQEAKLVLSQIASALCYLELNGLSHMDLSMRNIVVENAGAGAPYVRIVDWGTVCFDSSIMSLSSTPRWFAYRCAPDAISPEAHMYHLFPERPVAYTMDTFPIKGDVFALGLIALALADRSAVELRMSKHAGNLERVVRCDGARYPISHKVLDFYSSSSSGSSGWCDLIRQMLAANHTTRPSARHVYDSISLLIAQEQQQQAMVSPGSGPYIDNTVTITPSEWIRQQQTKANVPFMLLKRVCASRFTSHQPNIIRYFKYHKDLTLSVREVCVALMFALAKATRKLESFALSVWLLDSFLCRRLVLRNRLKLLCTACVLLADCVLQTGDVPMRRWINTLGQVVTKNELIAMCKIVQETLAGRLFRPLFDRSLRSNMASTIDYNIVMCICMDASNSTKSVPKLIELYHTIAKDPSRLLDFVAIRSLHHIPAELRRVILSSSVVTK